MDDNTYSQVPNDEEQRKKDAQRHEAFRLLAEVIVWRSHSPEARKVLTETRREAQKRATSIDQPGEHRHSVEMKGGPTMSDISSTREERIQWFAELDDDDQHYALVWLTLEKGSDPERRAAAAELLADVPLTQKTQSFLLDLIPDVEREQRIVEEHLRWRRARVEARWEAKDNFGKEWSRRSRRRKDWRCLEEEELAFFEPLLRQNRAKAPKIVVYAQMLREELTRQGIPLPVEHLSVNELLKKVDANFERSIRAGLRRDEESLARLENYLQEHPDDQEGAEMVEDTRQSIARRKQQLEEMQRQRQAGSGM
jgi:hypothetical protein